MCGVDGVIHQLAVVGLETGVLESEARRQPPENLGVRQCLADRRNHRLGALEPMVTVGGIEVLALEMSSRRKHDIAVLHALGHGDVDADEENVLARKRPLHAVLIGMHDDRIVIVDEDRPQRRIDVVALEMAAHVENVERARGPGQKIGPRELVGRLGKSKPRAQYDAAFCVELAEQRRQRNRGAHAAPPIAAALEPVAGRDDERL